MTKFKRVGFFVIFFFTLFQVMGNPTVKVNDKPLLTESHESEQSAQEIFSQESGEQDDQYSVNSSKSRIGILLIKESISPFEYFTAVLFEFNLWQPPQNN